MLRAGTDMDERAQLFCVGIERLRTLIVHIHGNKRIIRDGCRMPAHFEITVKPVVKTVSFAVGHSHDAFCVVLIAALFADFRYSDDAELETAGMRIIVSDLFIEPHCVEIYYVAVSARHVHRSAVAADKIAVP